MPRASSAAITGAALGKFGRAPAIWTIKLTGDSWGSGESIDTFLGVTGR
jgi:hypothetical protein